MASAPGGDDLPTYAGFNGVSPPDKEEIQKSFLNPVVMVLQPRASPNFSTPLRCKDFYTSSSSSCRICHEDESPERLISPCNCSGSLGLMHRKCLEKWLSVSNSDTCEICKFRFHIIHHAKPFWQWLGSGGFFGPKGFLGDVVCLLLLLPLSLISVYLCGFGAHNYINRHEWQATGLALLCFFLLMAFTLWCGVTFRYHYRMFRDWQKTNMDVQVIVHPPDNASSLEKKNGTQQHRNSQPRLGLVRASSNFYYEEAQVFGRSYRLDLDFLSPGSSGAVVETRL